MPLQPVPESPNQSTTTYKAPKLTGRASLAPFLSQAGNGTPPGIGGSSSLKKPQPFGGTTRPGTAPEHLPQYSPQDIGQQCPAGCVSVEAAAAYAGSIGWGGIIVGSLVSGAAGALGGYLLARWLR